MVEKQQSKLPESDSEEYSVHHGNVSEGDGTKESVEIKEKQTESDLEQSA